MKYKLFYIAFSLSCNYAFAQQIDFSKMNSDNTWLKVGLNAGLPLQSTSIKQTSFILGLDASMQFLETKASGIGIKTGYSHYFSAIDGVKALGEIPLAVMYRYYPKSTGFFTGLDLGYSFVLNSDNTKGGLMGRPHLGYHGNNWNIFGYYNIVLLEESNMNNLQSIGLSFTRNIRLKRK